MRMYIVCILDVHIDSYFAGLCLLYYSAPVLSREIVSFQYVSGGTRRIAGISGMGKSPCCNGAVQIPCSHWPRCNHGMPMCHDWNPVGLLSRWKQAVVAQHGSHRNENALFPNGGADLQHTRPPASRFFGWHGNHSPLDGSTQAGLLCSGHVLQAYRARIWKPLFLHQHLGDGLAFWSSKSIFWWKFHWIQTIGMNTCWYKQYISVYTYQCSRIWIPPYG